MMIYQPKVKTSQSLGEVTTEGLLWLFLMHSLGVYFLSIFPPQIID